MPLDIHICGAGFGEMIVLRWDENGIPRAGLIDAYSPSQKVEPLIRWLRSIGVDGLSFAVATHPHLDHVFNLDAVLSAFSGSVEYVWRWPGLDQVYWIMYFDKLARKFPASPNELGKRAKAVSGLFEECKKQFYDLQLGKPILQPVQTLQRIYPVVGPTQGIEVKCIGPWDGPSMQFVDTVRSGIQPRGMVTDIHREANLVSAGFIVTYGQSQVLLGGDMEDVNWQPLLNSGRCPAFKPCVVKVSHHGSANGRVNGMWGQNGFLGSHRPIAVVTPWNKALPEVQVLNEIRSSGCETYLTGQQRSGTREWLSRIQIRVHEDGRKPEVVFKSPTVELL